MTLKTGTSIWIVIFALAGFSLAGCGEQASENGDASTTEEGINPETGNPPEL